MSTKTTAPKRGDLRVYHITQVPMPAFRVDVPDVSAAAELLAVLADYDAFQLRHNVRGDYSSVQGLEVYDPDDDDPWCEWHSTEGMDIREHQRDGDDPETLIWEGAEQ